VKYNPDLGLRFLYQGLSIIAYLERFALVHTAIQVDNFYFLEDNFYLSSLESIYYQPGLNFSTFLMAPLGNPNYFAPEISDKCYYDTRSMIWSLAVTLFVWASGSEPTAPTYMYTAIKDPTLSEFTKIMLRDNVFHRPTAGKLLLNNIFSDFEVLAGQPPLWQYPYPLQGLQGPDRRKVPDLLFQKIVDLDKGMMVNLLQLCDVVFSYNPDLSLSEIVDGAIYLSTGTNKEPPNKPELIHYFTFDQSNLYLWQVADVFIDLWQRPNWPSLDFSEAYDLILERNQSYAFEIVS
jgi:hypothetical protein